jgi:hypothetical protein
VVWSRDDVLERGHRRLEHEPRSRVATATLAGLEVAKQDPPISQPRSQVDAALASRNAGSAGPPSESRRGEAPVLPVAKFTSDSKAYSFQCVESTTTVFLF